MEIHHNVSDLNSFKRKMAKKYNISCPKSIDLLKTYHKLVKEKRIKRNKKIEEFLKLRPVRSLSGIVNVSVLLKPYPCKGKCIFCPKEKGLPKSYLKKEPAVQRAVLNKFHPFFQTKTRLESLKLTGHPTDKIELRIIGGTWSQYPKNYQTWFVKQCFRACNNSKTKSLEKLQKENEKAKRRIIGITIETRPDCIDLKEIKRMRTLGITRVELGVQTVYNDILKINKRGHTIKETIKATKLLKDNGFKVSYQLMPNLKGSSPKKDIEMFRVIFSNPDFRPDLIKIYPLALVKSAPLHKDFKKGNYKPYSKEKLINLLAEIKEQIPLWCRIERVIRDIPPQYIVKGAKTLNLREIVQKRMKQKCKCIRCREVKGSYKKEKLYLFKEEYEASKGKEIFLSYENKNRTRLYALLRLRIRESENILPVLKNAALIREIHTYGQMTEIGKKSISAQHKGLGKKLIREAEKISKLYYNRIAVISGVGVRNYWRQLGYKIIGHGYMAKIL